MTNIDNENSIFKQITIKPVVVEGKESERERLIAAAGRHKRKKSKLRVVYRYTYRIAVMLVAAALVVIYIDSNKTDKQFDIAFNESDIDSLDNITLIAANGSKMDITSKEDIRVDKLDNRIKILDNVSKQSKKVVLNKERSEQFNTVIVPKGKIHKITLSDGTNVWINSAGVFKFPVKFSGNKRIVQLSGEAYFDVAKNPGKPFIVKTKSIDVTVLGTSFNVLAYMEDDEVTTTLVEGKVKITEHRSDKSVFIKPGEQAKFDKTNNNITLKNVNVNYYTVWKDGLYMFRQEKLHNVLKRIERTYDVEIKISGNQYKNILFSGKIVRHSSALETLKTLAEVLPIRIVQHNDRSIEIVTKDIN